MNRRHSMRNTQLAILIIVILGTALETSSFSRARMSRRRQNGSPASCMTGSTPLGTVCPGGSIYAGLFDSGIYMVTQGGCAFEASGTTSSYPTTDFTPTCSGTDSMTKIWKGGGGSDYDIPGVENVNASTKSSSNYRGNVNTAAIVAITSAAQGGYHAAARYCDKLSYGGYTDWYLPSKSEMAFIWCRGRTTGSGSYPLEDPACATYGYGSSSVVPGMSGGNYYWTSTEAPSTYADTQAAGGTQTATGQKQDAYLVRCIRRDPIFIGQVAPGLFNWNLTVSNLDVDYNANPESTAQTITLKYQGPSATSSVTLNASAGFSVVSTTCPGTSTLAIGATCTIDVKGTSAGRPLMGLHLGTLTASSSEGSYIINLAGTSVNLPDPCLEASPTVGTQCINGGYFIGTFDGGKYMVTDGGCGHEPSGTTTTYPASDFTPTCGGTDSLQKTWRGNANNYDIPGVENIGSLATPSSSNYRGHVNTAAIVAITAAGEGGYHPAARYCDKLDYGGHTDWYLPSKSELAFLWCRSRSTGGGSYPNENPACSTYGYGSSSVVPGLIGGTQYYWSSTESTTSTYAAVQGTNGTQTLTGDKSTAYYVRCVRRY